MLLPCIRCQSLRYHGDGRKLSAFPDNTFMKREHSMSHEKFPRSGRQFFENIGIAAAVLLTVAGTVLSMTVFRAPGFHADLDFLMALQNFREYTGDLLTGFFQMVTWCGSSYLTMPVLVLVYFGISTRLGSFLLQCVGYSSMLNGFLKLTVSALRPWVRDELIVPPGDAKIAATGYSFPSGHSTNATAVYGSLALMTGSRYRWLTAGFVCLLLLVLFSRNYLGVHTPEDVLIGFASTLGVVLLMCKIFRWTDTGDCRARGRRKWLLFLISIVISVLSAVCFECKSYPEVRDAAGHPIADPARLVQDSSRVIGLYLGATSVMLFRHYFPGYQAENAPRNERVLMTLGAGFLMLLLHLGMPPVLSLVFPAGGAGVLSVFVMVFAVFGVFPVLAAGREGGTDPAK